MDAAQGQFPVDDVADLLRVMRERGVKLWSTNGQLRYQAQKGALTQADLARLRAVRDQLVAQLDQAVDADGTEPRLQRYPRSDRVPLSFSQLAHWHLYGLAGRQVERSATCAVRLNGRLDVDALRASVAEMVRRHEALRTRIVLCDGAPMQEIAEVGDCQFEFCDLSHTPEPSRDAEVARYIDSLILEPIDVAVGPLFAVRALRLRHHEHVLIVATEHSIADGFSLNILMRELFAAYVQALRGQAFSLPPVQVQYADYAIWQHRSHPTWIEKHGAYWSERLAGCTRLRFPQSEGVSAHPDLGRGTVSVRIDRELKAALREWCRRQRTTLVMSLFAAYVALVLRWCDSEDAIFPYQINARSSQAIQSTIGYFATVLHLRVSLSGKDSLLDLVTRVTQEYCNAYEHADFSSLAAQMPQPAYTRNTRFNWIPLGSLEIDLSELDGSEHALSSAPVRFVYPAPRNIDIDREPFILLADAEDEIAADIYFALGRHSMKDMERFAQNFLILVRTLVTQPGQPVTSIALV